MKEEEDRNLGRDRQNRMKKESRGVPGVWVESRSPAVGHSRHPVFRGPLQKSDPVKDQAGNGVEQGSLIEEPRSIHS